jgi:hypothetical protein
MGDVVAAPSVSRAHLGRTGHVASPPHSGVRTPWNCRRGPMPRCWALRPPSVARAPRLGRQSRRAGPRVARPSSLALASRMRRATWPPTGSRAHPTPSRLAPVVRRLAQAAAEQSAPPHVTTKPSQLFSSGRLCSFFLLPLEVRLASLNPATSPPGCRCKPPPATDGRSGRPGHPTPPAPVGPILIPCTTPSRSLQVPIGRRARPRRAPVTGPPPASPFRRRGPNCCDLILSREIFVK